MMIECSVTVEILSLFLLVRQSLLWPTTTEGGCIRSRGFLNALLVSARYMINKNISCLSKSPECFKHRKVNYIDQVLTHTLCHFQNLHQHLHQVSCDSFIKYSMWKTHETFTCPKDNVDKYYLPVIFIQGV